MRGPQGAVRPGEIISAFGQFPLKCHAFAILGSGPDREYFLLDSSLRFPNHLKENQDGISRSKRFRNSGRRNDDPQ